MKLYLLFILFFGLTFNVFSQSKSNFSSRIFTNWPERWKSLSSSSIAADDDRYLSTIKLLGGSSRPIVFTGFNFDVPSTASINNIVIKIIRSKTGKNAVKDFACTLVTGPDDLNACGAFPNVANAEYWTTVEKTITYIEPSSGVGSDGKAFLWTPAMINAPGFGVFFDISFFSGGSGSVAHIEKVEVTVNYSEPTMKTAELNTINIKQNDKLIIVNAKLSGKYKFTVTDRFGRTLQQNILRNGMNEQVQLNNRCKGYCVITVEGNGQKKSMQVFIN